MQITCKSCGSPFQKLNRREFCSDTCRYDGRRVRNRRTPEANFWTRVSKSEATECWLWIGALDKQGYGKLFYGNGPGNSWRAHRFSYELHHGKINGSGRELFVCHKCDNPRCVNPAHLFLGTAKDNVHDMIAKGRAKMSHHSPSFDAEAARILYLEGNGYKRLSKRFGVSHQAIQECFVRRGWHIAGRRIGPKRVALCPQTPQKH